MSTIHKNTQRDFLARVNDIEYPNGEASYLSKKLYFDCFDGDRQKCYGGELKPEEEITSYLNLVRKGICNIEDLIIDIYRFNNINSVINFMSNGNSL